jgi:hypothetical protein
MRTLRKRGKEYMSDFIVFWMLNNARPLIVEAKYQRKQRKRGKRKRG